MATAETPARPRRPTLGAAIVGIGLALAATWGFSLLFAPYLYLSTPVNFRVYSGLLGLGAAALAGALYYTARERYQASFALWAAALIAGAAGFLWNQYTHQPDPWDDVFYSSPPTAFLKSAWLGVWLLALVSLVGARISRHCGRTPVYWGLVLVVAAVAAFAGGGETNAWREYPRTGMAVPEGGQALVPVFGLLVLGIILLLPGVRAPAKKIYLYGAMFLAVGLIQCGGGCHGRITVNPYSGSAEMRSINNAQQQYKTATGRYGSLAQLSAAGPPPGLDPRLGRGTGIGYRFVMTVGPGGQSYSVRATPVFFTIKPAHYFTNSGAVIFRGYDAGVDQDSPPLDY